MATQDLTIPTHTPLASPPRDLPSITAQEKASPLSHWNATVAFQLGIALRTRLLTFDQPAVIHISTLSSPPHVLFHSTTHSGTAMDNDIWIQRKRNSVIRFGVSTWYLHNKYEQGNEELFAKKLGLGERAGDYAIHGGGVPIFVENCDTPVAVAVVSGLKQWDDHQVVVEELSGVCKALGEASLKKITEGVNA